MTPSRFQDWVDLVAAASGQRWALGVGAVVAAVLASAFASIGDGRVVPAVIVIVVLLATISAVQPGSQTGTLVIGVVLWQWLAMVDDITTAWSIGVALALLSFHSATALMAVTPHTAAVDRRVLLLWLRRCVIVAAATVAIWSLAHVLESREGGGSVILTLLALVAVTAATIVIHVLTIDHEG